MSEQQAFQRLDQWLVQARFFKSRARAAAVCAAGLLRCDGIIVEKPHRRLRVGEVLTFPQGRFIRVVKVAALARRRGSPAEARLLFEDLNPTESQVPIPLPSGRSPLSPVPGAPAWGRRPDKRGRQKLRELSGKPGRGP